MATAWTDNTAALISLECPDMTTHECIEGNEAVLYAKTKLVQKTIDVAKWEVIHEDPKTGQLWLEDFLYPELQGGGIPRLRTLPLQDNPGDKK